MPANNKIQAVLPIACARPEGKRETAVNAVRTRHCDGGVKDDLHIL